MKALVILMFAGWQVVAAADDQLQLAGQAEKSFRAGDRSAGITLLERAAAAQSTAPSEDRIGFLYASVGHSDEAVTHFRKSLADRETYAPAHYHLGVMLWLQKDQAGAIKELQAAAALDPKSFDYAYRLGSAYLETGHSDQAVAELKTAAGLDPNKAEAWQQLGLAEQRAGDLAAAVQSLSKAVDLKPKDDVLRNGLAQLLVATRQPQKAIAEAETILQHHPDDETAHLNLGYANLKMGEYGKAEQAFRQLLALNGASIPGHYDLGIALKMQDELEAAQKEFQKAIELDPSVPESHYTLGITNWQLGDFDSTIQEMKAALALRPDYAEAHYMLGIAMKQTGDLAGATAELRASIRLDPTTPGPYNTLGQILRIQGDKAGSAEAFAKGTQLKSDKDKQLENSLDQGMRGNMMPKPMTAK